MTDDPQWDICIFCGCEGCLDGSAAHADDCPSETGVYPVTEKDLGPKCPHCERLHAEYMGCCRCDTKMRLGDFYHHIKVGEARAPDGSNAPIYEVVCAGCAAQEALAS